MSTKNSIRSVCGALAAAMAAVSCDSSTSPGFGDGADLSRAAAHAYGAWTPAVSIVSDISGPLMAARDVGPRGPR